MLDKIVAGFLSSYLGEYFENIDTEQVKISLWNGNVNLKNLKVRKDALRMFDTPYCISQGIIAELTITIPWTSLQSESVVIALNGVTLIVEEKGAAGYPVSQCIVDALHRRKQDLANAEEALLSEWIKKYEAARQENECKSTEPVVAPSKESDAVNNTFSARLKANIINNLKLEIKKLRVVFRSLDAPLANGWDTASGEKHNEIVLNIAETLSYACNENFEPTFSSVKLKIMYKVLNIKGVSISVREADVTSPLVKPFDFSINVQYQPVPYDARQPTYMVGILLDRIQTHINEKQVNVMTRIGERVMLANEREEKRLLRPVDCTPKTNPRLWWKYAIQSTILNIRNKQVHRGSSLSWKRVIDIKQKRDVYATLYTRSRRSMLYATGWLAPLNAAEEEQLNSLESELPIETIKLARLISTERVEIERKEYLKFKKQKKEEEHAPESPATQAAQPVPPQKKGWFSSWWRGSADTSSVKGKIEEQLEQETPETQEQIKKIMSLASADSWGEAERVAVAKEFGLSKEEREELEKSPSTISSSGVLSTSLVQWRVYFHFRSSTVSLFDSSKQTHGGDPNSESFLLLRLKGLTIGYEMTTEGHMEAWTVVENYGIEADLDNVQNREKVSEKLSIIDVERPNVDGKSSDHKDLFNLVAVMRNFDVGAFVKTFRYLQKNSIFYLTFKKKTADELKEYECPLSVQVVVLPFVLRISLAWLQQLVNFTMNAFFLNRLSVDATGDTSETLSMTNAEQTSAEVEEYDPFFVAPLNLTKKELEDISDPKARLLSLAHKLELACIIDWNIVLKGLTLNIVEIQSVQGCRLTMRDVSVKNDVVGELKRYERMINNNGSGTDHSKGSSKFGSEEGDWVDTVRAQIGQISAACLYVLPIATDLSELTAAAKWEYLLEPIAFDVEFKKNLLSRRQKDYPALSASISSPSTMKLNLSRSRLSVFCTSFSLMIDFFQSLSRKMMVTRDVIENSVQSPNTKREAYNKDGSAPSENLFFVKLAAMDTRYVKEHVPEKSAADAYYESFSPTQICSPEDRYIEIKKGVVIVYHQFRTTYPQQVYELIKDHYHFIVDDGSCAADIYFEQGGASHEFRKGIQEARSLLFEKLHFPVFDGNHVLLKRYTMEWLRVNANHPDKEQVCSALESFEQASHTVPCAHLRLTCRNKDDLDSLKSVLASCATEKGAYTRTAEVLENFRKSVPEELRKHKLAAFAITLPRIEVYLKEEEYVCSIDGEKKVASPGVNHPEKLLYMEKVSINGHQLLQSLSVSFGASNCAIVQDAYAKKTIGNCIEDDTNLLFSIGCTSQNDQDPNRNRTNVFLSVDMENQPGNFPSILFTTIKARKMPNHPMFVRVNASLMESFEQLYDLIGIMNNKALSYNNNIINCTPWETKWSDTIGVDIEKNYKQDKFKGGLLLQKIDLQVTESVIVFHLPSNRLEFTAETSDDEVARLAGKPLLSVHSDSMCVKFLQTAAQKSTEFSMDGLRLREAIFSGENKPTTWSNMITALPKDVSNTGNSISNQPSIIVNSLIYSRIPILSQSDFIRNGNLDGKESSLDEPEGLRVGHHVIVNGQGLRVFFSQRKMMQWLKVLAKGVAMRGISILDRQPFLYRTPTSDKETLPLLPWPRPDSSLDTPFSWCVMKKHVQFDHLEVYLSSHTVQDESSGSIVDLQHFNSSNMIRADITTLTVDDKWREEKDTEGRVSILSDVVVHLTKSDIFDICSGRLFALLSDIEVCMTSQVFQPFLLTILTRQLKSKMGEIVFHGNSTDVKQIFQFFAVNFSQPANAFQSRLRGSSSTAVEPLMAASLSEWQACGGKNEMKMKECSITSVEIAYACFHLIEKLQAPGSAPLPSLKEGKGNFARVASVACVFDNVQVKAVQNGDDSSTYSLQLDGFSIWDLSDLVQKSNPENVVFKRHPSEACKEIQCKWLDCCMDSRSPSDKNSTSNKRAVECRFQTSTEIDKSEQLSKKTIEVDCLLDKLQLSVIPLFCFNFRDAFFGSEVISGIQQFQSNGTDDSVIAPQNSTQINKISLGHFNFILPNVTQANELVPLLQIGLDDIYLERTSRSAATEASNVEANYSQTSKAAMSTTVFKIGAFCPESGFFIFPNAKSLEEENDLSKAIIRPILFKPPKAGFAKKKPVEIDELFSDAAPTSAVSGTESAKASETADAAQDPWFSFSYGGTFPGIQCTLGSSWFLMPHTHDILKMNCLWQEGGLSYLGVLATPLEERVQMASSATTTASATNRVNQTANQESSGMSTQKASADEESEWPEIMFQMKDTSIVMAEHGSNPTTVDDLCHGLLLHTGDVSFILQKQKSVQNNVETKQTKLQATIPTISLVTLSDLNRELLKPFSVNLRYEEEDSLQYYSGNVQCHVSAVNIHVARKYYELLLQSFVRHLLSTASGAAHMGFTQELEVMRCVEVPPRLKFLFGQKNIVKRTNAAALRRQRPLAEEQHEDVDCLSHSSASIQSQQQTPQTKARKKKPESIKVNVNMEGFSLKVSDNKTVVYLDLGALNCALTQHTFLVSDNNFSTSLETNVILPYFNIGVEGLRPLLEVNTKSNAEKFNLLQKRQDNEEEIKASLGVTTFYMDAGGVASAISLLYTPYARIVLPEYTLMEVKNINRDLNLTTDLILSPRIKMRVSNQIHNYITINGCGHHIFFNDNNSGEALLSLEEGVTLRIINAKIHINKANLEYYVNIGNGSYIIADRTTNQFFTKGGKNIDGEQSTENEEDEKTTQQRLIDGAAGMLNAFQDDTQSPAAALETLNRTISVDGQLHIFVTEPDRKLLSEPTNSEKKALQNIHLQIDFSSSISQISGASQPGVSNTSHKANSTASSGEFETTNAKIYITNLKMLSERATREGKMLGQTPILSNWSSQMQLEKSVEKYTKSDSNSSSSKCTQTITIVPDSGLEVSIRYSHIFLCMAAFQQAQRALQMAVGNIEVSTFTDIFTIKKEDYLKVKAKEAVEEKDLADSSSIMNINFTLPYLSFFIVNDSSSVDMPLFHFLFDSVKTPVAQFVGPTSKWHIEFFFAFNYYDIETTSWSPFIEKVYIDFANKHVANTSMEDVLLRKGSTRAGLHLRAAKVHVSPLFLQCVYRFFQMQEKFLQEQNLYLDSTSSGVKEQDTPKEEFFACLIKQNAISELTIQFKQDELNRFPEKRVLGLGEELNFNFPSVNGRELPASQQCVLLSIGDGPTEVLSVAYRGKQRVTLYRGITPCPIVAEIRIENGQKIILFRSNVLLENKLTFPIVLADGLGQLIPDGRLSIPVERLLDRVEFVPIVGGACESCSLGIRYESLPDLEGQTLICVSQVIDNNRNSGNNGPSGTPVSRGVPHVVYQCNDFEVHKCFSPPTSFFYLKLRSNIKRRVAAVPKQGISEDALGEDINGIFTALFYLRNKLQIPITANLLRLKEGSGRTKKILGLGLLPSSSARYELVATVEIAPGTVYGVTEIDPCEDVYISLNIEQRNGGKLGFGRRGFYPSCVYSLNNRKDLSETLTLEDQRSGAQLILNLGYIGNEVIITCPFFILNQTQYLLHILDNHPSKGDAPIAGLGNPGEHSLPPSDGLPFLFNSQRSRQQEDKAQLFVKVGVYQNNRQLQWSDWSDSVAISELKDEGTLSCRIGPTTALTLSFSVELAPQEHSDSTRLVVFRPRWIIINKSERALMFQQKRMMPQGYNLQSVGTPNSNQTKGQEIGQGTIASGSCQVLDMIQTNNYDNNNETSIQVCFESTDLIPKCEYSSSFSIDKQGDYTFNVQQERLIRLSDYWPQGDASQAPEALPPIQPEDIIELNKELYVRRSESEVMFVSCYTRCNSIMYVEVSIGEVGPLVIENRTDYMVELCQRDLPIVTSVYPKTTKNFTWHNAFKTPCMKLWVVTDISTGNTQQKRDSQAISIDFSPGSVIRNTQQFQQEITLPNQGGKMLFVRVRGIHGTSYAISIANEPNIDSYRTLPYAQFYYKLQVDALYVLFTNLEREDQLLLSVKPIEVSYDQGMVESKDNRSSSTPAEGDLQIVNVRLNTIQLDDERISMKQKVVFQLVDNSPTYIRVVRCLLRTTPILYMPEVSIVFVPFEFHIEDSFIFDTMKYVRMLKECWYGKDAAINSLSPSASAMATDAITNLDARGKRTVRKLSFAEACPWVSDSMKVASESDSANATNETKDTGKEGERRTKKVKKDWRLRVLFMERFFVEKMLVSISLYRTPLAQKDPMFQTLGVFSLLIRSINDARLDWQQIDQRNVCQSIWLLADYYLDQYKSRLRRQLPNLVNVVGLNVMRGLVTDLLHADGNEPSQARQKTRMGRRREAQFATDVEKDASNKIIEYNSHSNKQLSREENVALMNHYNLSLRTSFETFISTASLDEMRKYGHLFLAQSIRKSSVFPTLDFADLQDNNLRSTTSVLSALVKNENYSTVRNARLASMCSNCKEVENLRRIYLEGDPPQPLPHPKEGLVTFGNLAHHLSWPEITKICTEQEIRQNAVLWKDGMIGVPKNIVKIVT